MTNKIDKTFIPKNRTKNIITQEINDETLVYNLKTNKAVCVNKTLATVWKLCDGNRNIQQIAKAVSNEFKKPVSDELIYLSLTLLADENLLVNKYGIGKKIDGLSRRELIRKVGVTSMIALPLISSVVAPNAVDAQSNTCANNVCFAANTDACVDCTGQTINVTQYNSTDGSCSGGIFLTRDFVCGNYSVPRDVLRG